MPTPKNYFIGYDTSVTPTVAKNDVCQPGSYSPQGQRRCTSCSGGKYCPNEWMKDESTAGTCRQGFYCVSGVTKPTPNNPLPTSLFTYSTTLLNVSTNAGNKVESLETTIQGNICPVGSYCEAGVSVAKQCDPGFFLSYQGATAVGQCMACPAGLYCPYSGFSDPYDTLATAKFQNIQTTYYCSQGYFCES